jgi:hypothetical protein
MLRIRVIFGYCIRIRIRAKSWILMGFRIKVIIQKLWRLKMEPCMAWTLTT